MIELILASILVGILLSWVVQFYIFRYWFQGLPRLTPDWKSQSDAFVLPKELQDYLDENTWQNVKESYKGLNFIFQFLFQEIKDAEYVRRWAMKKLKVEFTELLQSTTGKLLDDIRIRGFNLGHTFPVISNVTIANIALNEDKMLDEVSLMLDLSYNGRFELAVDVDMVFGKTAYLSVTVTKLKGRARLQFVNIPYKHWSFAFIEDPTLEFEVDSHFEGRPLNRITSIITNQIRRSVRKKHTLPNYKMRLKPFFVLPTNKVQPQDVYYNNSKLSVGNFTVVVVGCTRLLTTPNDSVIFCSLSLDNMPWTELMSFRRKLWVAYDVEVCKGSSQLGIIFEDKFLLDKYDEVVIVTSVTPGLPASRINVQKNDIITFINGVKVTSSKQAARLIKLASDKVQMRIERSVQADDNFIGGKKKEGEGLEDDVIKNLKVPSATLVTSNNIDNKHCADSLTSLQQQQHYQQHQQQHHHQDILSDDQYVHPPNPLLHKLKVQQQLHDNNIDSMTSTTVTLDISTNHNHLKNSPNQSEPPNNKKGNTASPLVDFSQSNKANNNQSSASSDKKNLVSMQEGKATSLSQPSSSLSAFTQQTRMYKSCQSPVFNQKFKFQVGPEHNFLNLCVWCREVEKVDKQSSKSSKLEKDVLIGHVSVSLMDVALECSTTLQGDFTSSFNLVPSKAKLGKGRIHYSEHASHSGFDEKLCHGDVLLRFQYSRDGDNKSDIDRDRSDNVGRSEVVSGGDDVLNVLDSQFQRNGVEKKNGVVLEVDQQLLPTNQMIHSFQPVQFQSAVYCKFCSKKIWFKSAFMCKVCRMVCHKKCIDKCQQQTQCTKQQHEQQQLQPTIIQNTNKSIGSSEGERKRHKSAPDENNKEVTKVGQVMGDEVISVTRKSSSSSLKDLASEDDQLRKVNSSRPYIKTRSASEENNADERIVTAAKVVGRQLYVDLEPEARKVKFDQVIQSTQQEIERESRNQNDLMQLEKKATDKKIKNILQGKYQNSEDKLKSLKVLMLQYCAGLQSCLDEEEALKQKLLLMTTEGGSNLTDGILDGTIERLDEGLIGSKEDVIGPDEEVKRSNVSMDESDKEFGDDNNLIDFLNDNNKDDDGDKYLKDGVDEDDDKSNRGTKNADYIMARDVTLNNDEKSLIQDETAVSKVDGGGIKLSSSSFKISRSASSTSNLCSRTPGPRRENESDAIDYDDVIGLSGDPVTIEDKIIESFKQIVSAVGVSRESLNKELGVKNGGDDDDGGGGALKSHIHQSLSLPDKLGIIYLDDVNTQLYHHHHITNDDDDDPDDDTEEKVVDVGDDSKVATIVDYKEDNVETD